MGGALRQGKLPPQALDARCPPFVLYCLAKLLIDHFHLGRGGRFVAYARKTEEIAGTLCPTCTENKSPPHSHASTQQTSSQDPAPSRTRPPSTRHTAS